MEGHRLETNFPWRSAVRCVDCLRADTAIPLPTRTDRHRETTIRDRDHHGSCRRPSTTPPAAAPATQEKPMSQYENKVAELHTSAGQIDIRFFPDVAPNHVKNFIDLAQQGLLRRHEVPSRHPRLHDPGRRPEHDSRRPEHVGHRRLGERTSRPSSTAIPHKRGIVSDGPLAALRTAPPRSSSSSWPTRRPSTTSTPSSAR